MRLPRVTAVMLLWALLAIIFGEILLLVAPWDRKAAITPRMAADIAIQVAQASFPGACGLSSDPSQINGARMTFAQANERFFSSVRSEAAPDHAVWAVLLRGIIRPDGLGNTTPPSHGQMAVMFDDAGLVRAWTCYPLGGERTTDGLLVRRPP